MAGESCVTVSENRKNLLILQRFEELLTSKLDLCMQLQSLVDTSAQSLDAFRTHCSTSRELIKDEIRMLEGKLIQRIGRQLALRRILTGHFLQLSQELHVSQYLETDLDLFLAQQSAEKDGCGKKLSSCESLNSATETGETAVACLVDRIKLILDEELSLHPNLRQWLEIVGLQPVCIKGVIDLVGTVEELLQTSESKLKSVIVASNGECSCRIAAVLPSDFPESASEDTLAKKESPGLRVDQSSKEKGKLPFHIREDVRRLITACRLLRIYTDRLITDDNDLRELSMLIPTHLAAINPATHPLSTCTPLNSSTSSSATPPNSLVRKESVKSLYWDSWRCRPAPAVPHGTQAAGTSEITILTSPEPQSASYCCVHYSVDRKYGMMEPRGRGHLPSMMSSFSSDDNFLSSPSMVSQSYYPLMANNTSAVSSGSVNNHRLTSQSSVMSSVSTATTTGTGDEADLGSTFADLPSASSSCANSVFPSANNILQLVQQYEISPDSMKKSYASIGADERDSSGSLYPPLENDAIIRPSLSTPSLLLTGNPSYARPAANCGNNNHGVTYHPGGGSGIGGSHASRKELLKFTKSSSLESSLRSRLSSDEPVLPPLVAADKAVVSLSGSSGSSTSGIGTLGGEKGLSTSRRMHHSIHHVFKNHLFLTHTICAYCEKTLRGLGRKCRHCKFRCHADCAEKAPPSCGLPDGLVREYFIRMNPGKIFRPRAGSENHTGTKAEPVQVEDDDETLSDYRQRKFSDVVELVSGIGDQKKLSSASEASKKHWRPNFRLFTPKSPPATIERSLRPAHGRIRKQRSKSTGNALEEAAESHCPPGVVLPAQPLSPTQQLKSPITRRISGSFSLPRDRRKRKNNLVLLPNDQQDQEPTGDPSGLQHREMRIFSDPSPLEHSNMEKNKRRTASASSGADGISVVSPLPHASQDSLSGPSSSMGSSGRSSVPESPGGLSYGRSGSASTGPPISPLALSSFVNPRTYRSFVRTVKDQIKSHFHWPVHAPTSKEMTHHPKSASDSCEALTEVRKTPLVQRRRSSTEVPGFVGKRKDCGESTLDDSEAVRLEEEDSFPAEVPLGFSAVLVAPLMSADIIKRPVVIMSPADDAASKQTRRFSLLEPQEEVDLNVPPQLSARPSLEVEEENEPNYLGDMSGDITTSSIPWRRQQSLYLRELNIPFEQIIFGDKLGQGTFGQVHKGKWHGDVAIKILNDDYLYNDADDVHEAFKQDLATLRKTRHDNLVLFMGACMKRSHDRHQQVIITSLLSRGVSSGSSTGSSITLHDLIHEQRNKSLTAPYKAQLNRLLIIATQISQGMGYLHRRGIVHKNLKSRNVFVTHEKCIITDYGLFSISKMPQHGRSDDFLWFPKNWLCYLAPELCRHLQTPRQQKFSFSAFRDSVDPKSTFGVPFSIFSDVYAFGSVLYELCTGSFPSLWSASNAQRLYNLSQLTTGTPSNELLPVTPGVPQTPTQLTVLSSVSSRLPRPADPNLPGSLESAVYLVATGSHPIFRFFRSRANRSVISSAATATPAARPTAVVRHPGSPPQSLAIATAPGTPPTPMNSAPVNLLSPSIDEAAARELIELISLCWSPKISHRKEFQEISQMLERVPKKSLARSPSHPVHGNTSFPKDTIAY